MSHHENSPDKSFVTPSTLHPFVVLFFAGLLLMELGCGGGSSGGTGGTNPPPPPPTPTFVTVDAPGASSTMALSINAGGDITGTFTDSNNAVHGFLRRATGTLSVLDAPGAGTLNNQGTYAEGINASGTIGGYIVDQNDQAHGFLRTGGGSYTAFDVPGANSTFGRGLSDGDEITGEYFDSNNLSHGYVRASDGTITTFDVLSLSSTLPKKVNAGGTVVGTYTDSNSYTHGFTRDANGAITGINVPNPAYGGKTNTFATDINASGVVVGQGFLRSGGPPTSPSFVRAAGGSFTTYSPTGANSHSRAESINDSGAIVGNFADTVGASHGYLRNPDGTLVVLDDPQAALSTNSGTVATDINANGAIAGYYHDQSNVKHGFLRK